MDAGNEGGRLMSTLEEKKAMRLKFMNALYEESDADENVTVEAPKLAEAMGLKPPEPYGIEEHEDHHEYRKVVSYLEGEGLIRRFAAEPFSPVSITHRGVVEVERALSSPTQPTRYFAPAATVINYIGSMVNSQAQQSGPASAQSLNVVSEKDRQETAAFVGSLKDQLDRLDLDEDGRRELEAEIKTIEAQLSGPNPKVPITKAALQSVQRVLEGTAANAASSGLLGAVTALINGM